MSTDKPERSSTEAIGIDHVYLTVSSLERSEAFYDKVMPLLGFKKEKNSLAGEPHVHYYCRHFGFSLRPARAPGPHDPYSPGLHHFCFRVDGPEGIDELYRNLRAAGVECSPPRLYPEYSPDYYALFFRDPDGIELEATNFRAQRRRHLTNWEGVS